MTHSEMEELYELYVLGALEPEQTADIGQHVREQCSYCLEHIQEAQRTVAAMAGLAEQEAPSRALRNQILASVARSKVRKPYPGLLVAGLSAACLALIGFAIWAGVRIISQGGHIDALTAQRD